MKLIEEFIKKHEEEMGGYFDPQKVIDTVSMMHKFRRTFSSVESVDSAINEAQEYYRAVIGLLKEVGLSKNNDVMNLKTEISEKNIANFWSSSTEDGIINKRLKTATEKKEYQKLKSNEMNIELHKLESDYDVLITFLNDQKWMMTSYLKSLDERRKHQVAMVNLDK